MQTKVSHSNEGFTLVETMIVVTIVALLAVIAVPNFMRARTNSQQTACINNLRKIEDAKQQWALDTRQAPSALPADTQIQAYLGRSELGSVASVVCPSDSAPATILTSYNINKVDVAATCRIVPLGTGTTDHILPN